MSSVNEAVNRRRYERRPYVCTRRMAPYGAGSPLARDYHDIECRDLSAGGIGFFAAEKPSSDDLRIELGEVQGSLCIVVARVVYCRLCCGEAIHRYNIGCQFIKRLN